MSRGPTRQIMDVMLIHNIVSLLIFDTMTESLTAINS